MFGNGAKIYTIRIMLEHRKMAARGLKETVIDVFSGEDVGQTLTGAVDPPIDSGCCQTSSTTRLDFAWCTLSSSELA